MFILYSIAIQLYGLCIYVASLFHPKAKAWIDGRKNWKSSLDSIPKDKRIIWFHCASTGEYEQGKPVIRALKEKYPDSFLLLSFFSPSGYRSFKPSPFVDQICYLPLDTPANAKSFIAKVNPSLAVFVKYEIWFNYLNQLSKLDIPTYLISARFYKKHIIFRSGFAFLRNKLKAIATVFVQDQNSYDLLRRMNFNNVILSGDTRLDQVLQNKKETFQILWLQGLVKDKKCLIAGSTWPKDEEILLQLRRLMPELLIILAPHEYDSTRIANLQSSFGKYCYNYTQLSDRDVNDIRTLILDKMGLLKYIYRYADYAYVGGGFGKGIHNILEPAVYNIPVFFGPHHPDTVEANHLVQVKIAYEINSSSELHRHICTWTNSDQEVLVENMANYIEKYKMDIHEISTYLNIS